MPTDVRPMQRLGMENHIWALGDEYVLRIPLRGDPAGMVVEALTVPVAREAGVRTPDLVVFDETRELTDDVYTIYERAPGHTLGTLDCDLRDMHLLLRDLAEDIVKLHHLPNPGDKLQPYHPEDSRHDFKRIVDTGRLSVADADTLEKWLDALRPALEHRPHAVFTHNDLHPWNLMAETDPLRLGGILDWSDCVWGDPAFDLIGLPLPLTISLTELYRDAGGYADEHLEARILWCWLDLALWEVADLDASVYRRCWWRWPEVGVPAISEMLRTTGGRWAELRLP
jgi:hygromycin-B 7''-O-kinase